MTEPSRREWPPQELTATGSSGGGHSSRVCQGPTKVTLKGPNVGTSILEGKGDCENPLGGQATEHKCLVLFSHT